MITAEQVEAMQRRADKNAAWQEQDEAGKDLENGIYDVVGFVIGVDIEDTEVLIIQPF